MGAWHLVAGLAIVAVIVGAGYVLVADDWVAADLRRALRRRVTYVVGVPSLLVVFGVGVPYVYLASTSVEAVPPMTFEDLPGFSTSTTMAPVTTTGATTADATATSTTAGDVVADVAPADAPVPTEAPVTTQPPAALDGHWVVSAGSQARYGIDDEVLLQTQRVVGTTDQVSGSMDIADSVVQATTVVVDMRSVHCDCVHDEKYQDLLDTDAYPTSTFELTSPIPLTSIPPDGEIVSIAILGNLTIHGVTQGIQATVDAVQRGGHIGINATIPLRLEDYGIERPDVGPVGSINNPAIELLIGFERG